MSRFASGLSRTEHCVSRFMCCNLLERFWINIIYTNEESNCYKQGHNCDKKRLVIRPTHAEKMPKVKHISKTLGFYKKILNHSCKDGFCCLRLLLFGVGGGGGRLKLWLPVVSTLHLFECIHCIMVYLFNSADKW